MGNINVRFIATADFGPASAQIKALQGQVAALNAQLNKTATSSYKFKGIPDPQQYRGVQTAINRISRDYRDAVAATGQFEVSQMRVASSTERLTEDLMKQKLSIGDIIRQRKQLTAVYQEQIRLQRMTVMGFHPDPSGRTVADIAVPSQAIEGFDTLGKKVGWVRTLIGSAATQMVNLGKNIQWAGRQLMVGFTVPVAAFAATTGVLAYQANQNLTRIAKVYDTTQHDSMTVAQQAAANATELANVQAQAMNVAKQAAADYGASMNDTLDAAAQLAATGMKGATLLANTREVMKIATLGEMDYNTALNATISLSSVFHRSAAGIANDFNYINAVENATSLTMQDFAAAIPIAAQPIKHMGGDIRTLGTLLVAMRSNGIQAVQGANAIKSAVTRIFNPSTKVQDSFKAMTGISIEDLRAQAHDQIIPIFQLLYEKTKDLTRDQKLTLFAQLFGTWQGTRLSAILQGMQDLADGVGQVSRANQIALQGNAKNAKIADTEIRQYQQSAAGQFKRTVQTLKVQLAEMGKPFLEMGTTVVNILVKIIQGFNSLPSVFKKGLTIIPIAAAIIGPITMMVGLFLNMTGTIAKVINFFLRLGGSMNLFTARSKLMQMLMEKTTSVQETQAKSTAQLAEEMNALAASIDVATSAQARQMQLQYKQDIMPPRDPVTGRLVSRPPREMWVTQEQMFGRQLTPQPKEGWSGMQKAAVWGGVMSTAMAASVISSNKLLDNISQMVMVAALLAPAFSVVPGLIKKAGDFITASLLPKLTAVRVSLMASAETATVGSVASSLGGGLKAAGGALLGMATSTMGISVALGAAAYGAYKLYQNGQRGAEQMHNMFSDVTGLSKILNYTPTDGTLGSMINAKGLSVPTDASKVDAFKKDYGDVVDMIRQAGQGLDGWAAGQAKLNAALTQAAKVINTGGTAEQAKQAVEIALTAAQGQADAHKIIMHFQAQLDFNKLTPQINANIQLMRQSIQQGLAHAHPSMSEQLSAAVSFGFVHGRGSQSISNTALAAGDDAAKSWVSGFNQALSSGNSGLQQKMILALQKQLEDFRTKIQDATKRGDIQTASYWADLRERFLGSILSDKGVSNARDLIDGISGMTDSLKIASMIGVQLTQQQQLQILNYQRMHGGLTENEKVRYRSLLAEQKTKDSVDGQAAAYSAVGGALTDVNTKAEQLAATQAAMAKAFKAYDFTGAMKSAYGAAEQELGQQMSDSFAAQEQQAMSSLQARGQAQLAAMDKQRDARLAQYDAESKRLQAQQQAASQRLDAEWQKRIDAVTKAYDARIKAVQNEMDAEQAAADQRQKIFDAEEARIQQLADMANRTIDFNVALEQGNLDEAARVRNDADAAYTQNVLSQASQGDQDQAQKQQAALQKILDGLNSQKDARLQLLQKQEDAAKQALQKEQQLRLQDLQNERDHYEKIMAIRRTAAENTIQMNQDAAQKEWDARKATLDKEIAAYESYIPTSVAKLEQWTRETGQKYDEFGKQLDANGAKWSQILGTDLKEQIGNAARSLKTDINWAGIAGDMAAQMAKGAFNMTLPQFQKWVGLDAGITGSAATRQDSGGRKMGTPVFHEGGPVGGRTGFPNSAPPFPQEQMALVRKDEYIVDGRTHRSLGTGFFDGLKDRVRNGMGGPSGPMGLTGVVAAGMAKTMNDMVRNTITNKSVMAGGMYSHAAPGIYGNSGDFFDAAQLANAAIIATVGKSLGASTRDIVIALMTAMQESMLRNVHYGDRDSLGLFQQRAAWGTVEERMNPSEAARMFFQGGHQGQRGLFDIPGRNDMSLAQAAQAVQVSAYPSAYAKWADEAEAILRAMTVFTAKAGSGGWHTPLPGHHVTNGFGGGHWGVDFSVGTGTPVYAAGDGRVSESRDIRGYEPRRTAYGLPQDGFRSYGRVITIDTPVPGGFLRTLYAHNSERLVQLGQIIRGGQLIARSGGTGNATGPHLHFETDPNGRYPGVDPVSFMAKHGVQLFNGGEIKWDNTVANLHKKETVLTAPLSQELKDGIRGMKQQQPVNLELKIYASDNMDEEQLARSAAREALKMIADQQSRIGYSRTVGR